MNKAKEIVAWLRERARTSQHHAEHRFGYLERDERRRSDEKRYCAEAEYADKFADEIERLFVYPDQLKNLQTPATGQPRMTGVVLQPRRSDKRNDKRRRHS